MHRVRTARFAGHLGPSSNPARQLQRQQRPAKKHPDHLTIGLDLPSISDTQSGVGLGQGSTSIDENSTRVAHKSMGVTLYAQRPLPHQLAVQLIAGLGQTSFDNQRYAQTDNTLLGSERKAQGWHASLGVSHTSALAADIIFQPYARLSYMAARFDSTQESGSGSANAVAMDTLHTRRQSLTAGATLSKTITTANALKWTPFVGVQWQQPIGPHALRRARFLATAVNTGPAKHWGQGLKA